MAKAAFLIRAEQQNYIEAPHAVKSYCFNPCCYRYLYIDILVSLAVLSSIESVFCAAE